MIEVTIDFKNIKTKEELIKYVAKELKFYYKTNGTSWDAYQELLANLRFEEIPKNYLFSLEDDWGWNSYDEYKIYLQDDSQVGLKNDEGIRDNLNINILNFYLLLKINRSLAIDFLEKTLLVTRKKSEYDRLLRIILTIQS